MSAYRGRINVVGAEHPQDVIAALVRCSVRYSVRLRPDHRRETRQRHRRGEMASGRTQAPTWMQGLGKVVRRGVLMR